MGCTAQAFACYRKALEGELPVGIRGELADVILEDLYKGGKKAAALARKKDAMEYLDHWLGKYENLETLQGLFIRTLNHYGVAE